MLPKALRLTFVILALLATFQIASPVPAESQCVCTHGGASCGVELYNIPCGVVVCGNDYRTYKCVSGSWVKIGQVCTC